jgi:hypothetical protein
MRNRKFNIAQPNVFCLLPSALGALLLGCASEASDKPSGYDRSESALRDPMNYSPGLGTKDKLKSEPAPRPENSFKRDFNTVFNP